MTPSQQVKDAALKYAIEFHNEHPDDSYEQAFISGFEYAQKEGWVWTDELVKEFVELITTEPNKDFVRVYTNDRMIEFKQLKTPLPSPPTTDKK